MLDYFYSLHEIIRGLLPNFRLNKQLRHVSILEQLENEENQ